MCLPEWDLSVVAGSVEGLFRIKGFYERKSNYEKEWKCSCLVFGKLLFLVYSFSATFIQNASLGSG